MSKEEIMERLTQLIAEHFDVDADQLNEGTQLAGDLQADSLDVVEVVMAVEEEFGIEVSDDAAEHLKTVGDAANYIAEQVS